jgi:hypothetical protein
VNVRRIRTIAVGAAVVLVYVAGPAVSGRLGPLTRRPLLDGFAPPPAYHWVNPPPDLAAGNQRPASGSFTVKVDPRTGSGANVLSTTDAQVSLALSKGAIPPLQGKSSVRFTIQPSAPVASATMPRGLELVGNAYAIRASWSAGGPAVTELDAPAQLVLFYPPSSDNLVHRHTVVFSNDGKTWTAVSTTDSAAQQLATANVSELGWFAVASSVSGHPKPFPIGTVLEYVALGLLALYFLVSWIRARRRSSATDSSRAGAARDKRRTGGRS